MNKFIYTLSFFIFHFFSYSQSDEYCHLIATYQNIIPSLIEDDFFVQNKQNVIIGNFLNNANANTNPDEVVLIDDSGKFASMYGTCTNGNQRKIWTISNQASLFANWVGDPINDHYVVGDFTGNGKDELLCINPSNDFDALLEYNGNNNSCTGSVKTGADHWSNFYISGDGHVKFWATASSDIYQSGDYDGDGKDELLCINPINQFWHLYRFVNDDWEFIASGSPSNPMLGNFSTSHISPKSISGKFIALKNQSDNGYRDVLFTVRENTSFYGIQYFDIAQNTFVGYFNSQGFKKLANQNIRPEDVFYKSNFNGDCRDEIVKYNRKWRYDMKLFEYYENGGPAALESNFYLKGNIDYKSNGQTYQNPKFYEFFLPIFGNFTYSGKSSIFTAVKNAANSPLWSSSSFLLFSGLDALNTVSDCPTNALSLPEDNQDTSNENENNLEYNRHGWLVYPNPVSEYLTIDFRAIPSKEIAVSIYTVEGKLITVEKVTLIKSNKLVLSMTEYPKGFYLLSVNLDNRTLSQKLIIQ